MFVKYAVFTGLGIVYVLSIAVTSAVSELELINFFFAQPQKRLMTLLRRQCTVISFLISHNVYAFFTSISAILSYQYA